MYTRLLKLPFEGKKSFFLFGPRGTGKTLCVTTQAKESIYIDLLESRRYTKLLADPQGLENLIPNDYKGWVIIDEVQKIPALLNEVHRLIEKKRYKFILTGSSARSLRRKGVNLLAGRALTYYMYPLTAIEFGNDFNLEHVLKYGGIAAVSQEKDPKRYLDSYIQTYLKEEVMQEGLTRNVSDFARFLETASFSQASLINMSAISRDCGIHQKVVTSYFNILEDLLLSYRIYPFTKKAKRRLVTHRKFYYFDVGIYYHLRPKGPFDKPEEIGGAALESFFYQELRAINDYFQYDYKIYFWRTSSGIEVDFVLYGERGLKAFEIKHSKNVNNKDFKGLKEFKKDYKEADLYMIYGGDDIQYYGDIKVIPFCKMIKQFEKIL